MHNKKLGVVFLVISVILTIIIIQLIGGLNTEARDLGCFDNEACIKVESSLSIAHVAFGFIGFVLSLGFYLLFFSKSEEAILKRLEENKEDILRNERFSLILKGLDFFEKKVLKVARDQDGIKQNTLRIRTDMSKAKLSYVIQGLEKKGLIKRVRKGRTFAVYLKEKL